MSLDAPRAPAPPDAVRFVDVHSGRGARFESFEDVAALVACVACRVEGGVAGRRFPLVRVLGARRPLTGTECEALTWELARLRTILSTMPIDPVPGAPAARPGPTGVGSRTLVEAHLPTILALDHAARLGAASRRGARFATADDPAHDGSVAARPLAEGR